MTSLRETIHQLQGQRISPPDAYDLLGDLTETARELDQLSRQLTASLARASRELPLTHDGGGDPAFGMSDAEVYLARAADCARQLATALDAAQQALGPIGVQ